MQLERFRESFAATYLTLLSILQGVLLGLLATLVDSKVHHLGLDNWLRITTSVVLVITVWNEYRMGTTQFVWVPNIADTLVPFVVGVVQLGVLRASFLSSALWFGSLSGLYLVGVIGYENMYRQAAADQVNEEALRVTGRWRYVNPIVSGTFCCLFALFAAVAPFAGPPRWVQLGMTTVALVLSVAFLFRGELNWRTVVRYVRAKERERAPGQAAV